MLLAREHDARGQRFAIRRSGRQRPAAVVAGLSALGFGFWLSAVPALARQPLFFFSFVFLADAGLLALPVIGRAHRGIALGAGSLTFILVAEWIGLFAPHAPLIAALAAIVIFALLHAATVPASAWRPGVLPFTAAGTVTPFLLLILLLERVAALESDAGFWRRTHSHRNSAGRRDCETRGLARAFRPAGRRSGGTDLAGSCGFRTNRRSPRSCATDCF